MAFLLYPQEAASSDIASKFAIHRWKLETLLNEVLTTNKLELQRGRRNRRLDCRRFEAIAGGTNALAGLENAEDGLTLKRVTVLREVHRLSQRQFEWQRGFLSYSQLYRAAFVYGGDQTTTFFTQTNGFTIANFGLTCFVLRTLFLTKPIMLRPGNLDIIGVPEETLSRILSLITISHANARMKASKLRSGAGHTGYKRSLFREYPCIAFGREHERVHAPLPDLIILRATSGLFYDVVKGSDSVRNEISARFET